MFKFVIWVVWNLIINAIIFKFKFYNFKYTFVYFEFYALFVRFLAPPAGTGIRELGGPGFGTIQNVKQFKETEVRKGICIYVLCVKEMILFLGYWLLIALKRKRILSDFLK